MRISIHRRTKKFSRIAHDMAEIYYKNELLLQEAKELMEKAKAED